MSWCHWIRRRHRQALKASGTEASRPSRYQRLRQAQRVFSPLRSTWVGPVPPSLSFAFRPPPASFAPQALSLLSGPPPSTQRGHVRGRCRYRWSQHRCPGPRISSAQGRYGVEPDGDCGHGPLWSCHRQNSHLHRHLCSSCFNLSENGVIHCDCGENFCEQHEPVL